MKVTPVKTRMCKEGEDLAAFILTHVPKLKNGSILAVTSKIVALSEGRTATYTTTLKQIQVMTEKGFLLRSEVGRQHLYRARQSERATQKRLVQDLLDRAFGGTSGRLVLQALASRPASTD